MATPTARGLSAGKGTPSSALTGQILFDVAYELRTGMVKSPATGTSVQQHRALGSIIYHF
jgi:hypothetical protein